MLVKRPVRKANDLWEYVVRLIDNDYSSLLDISGCQVGDTTRFQSNAMPEMHEEGLRILELFFDSLSKFSIALYKFF